MATIHFVIRTSTKGTLAPVYLKFSSGREVNTSVKTGLQVFPEYWSSIKEEIKDSIAENQVITLEDLANQRKKFIDLKGHVQTELNNLASKGGQLSREWLQTTIYKFHHQGIKTDKPENLNDYISRFINEIESGTRLHGEGMKYRKSTVKSFKSTQTNFNEFQGRKRLNFDDITLDTHSDFVKYLTGKNLSLNYIGKLIKNLKTIMRSAREEGLHRNNEIDRKGFKVFRIKVANVYLNEEEIKRMFELDLSDQAVWDQARDIFLIGCYTAQRFSDYSRITPEMIREKDGIKYLDLFQQKTGHKVVIPVRPELDILLKKYHYRLPKTWEQKVNLHIKKVADKAKITEPVQVEESKGGLIKKTTVTKDKLIKTHTARRSGCTNMFLAGIPTLSIMKISGHKTEKEFLKYINVSEEETAIVLADHPYFNTTLLKIAK